MASLSACLAAWRTLEDSRDAMYIHSKTVMEATMQVAKWGNSLAVRLPSALVRELGLKEGDQIDLVKDDNAVKVRRHARAGEVLADLRRFRGRLPAAERLGRDDAHER